jgi:hypothetical protein
MGNPIARVAARTTGPVLAVYAPTVLAAGQRRAWRGGRSSA